MFKWQIVNFCQLQKKKLHKFTSLLPPPNLSFLPIKNKLLLVHKNRILKKKKTSSFICDKQKQLKIEIFSIFFCKFFEFSTKLMRWSEEKRKKNYNSKCNFVSINCNLLYERNGNRKRTKQKTARIKMRIKNPALKLF